MESIFIQAFKLALEFFYDGSAMPANQGKLWEVLDALGGSAVPDQPVTINEDYYCQRARELMLRRKGEIKLRLLELDDSPSRSRELRAEMKGIDYGVSILDKNHWQNHLHFFADLLRHNITAKKGKKRLLATAALPIRPADASIVNNP